MKAMMLKDIKILFNNTKYYLFIMVLFTLIGALNQGYSIFQFYPVLLMAILPITALSYDERCRWNLYGLTLPCSRRDLVLGKYFLGILGCILMGMINLAANIILPPLTTHRPVDSAGLTNYMIYVMAASIIFLDLNLPLMFRLGTEKGRIFYLCAIVVIIAVPTVFSEISASIALPIGNLLFTLPVITVLLTIVSMALSVRIFRKKEF